MDFRALQAEILSGPLAAACAPHVNDGSDPSRKRAAPADDAAIAEILSAGRTRIARKVVDDGDVAVALGIPDGPVFLYQLEHAATDPPAPGDIVAHAIARQVWRSLTRGSFDVGDDVVRTAIDAMVGRLLTAEQATTIKDLAVVPDPVSTADVSRAMRGPWGDE